MRSTKVLNLLVFLCGLIAIIADHTDNITLFRFFKPLTTILIILIPLFFGKRPFRKYDRYLILGLFFCLLGDIFLLDSSYFILGLGSFLLAHILFTAGFISIDGWKKHPLPLAMLLLFGISYYWFLYDSLSGLAIPVLLYFVFIIIMCWQGISLYLWQKKNIFRWVSLGVLLFLCSDAVLAVDKFKMPFAESGILILSSYWLAIWCLANSTRLPIESMD